MMSNIFEFFYMLYPLFPLLLIGFSIWGVISFLKIQRQRNIILSEIAKSLEGKSRNPEEDT
ncbi:hypothetical protein SAMN05216244_2309 [Sediminibacillus halophilus]|uniref:Uncharacterized protein n=1 Tax=Sediminibacillus halophilus TaxID=482461 RepID=A0A1G9S8N6_9BACI|nr:hypothetical protein SAMN05216244_2309 [Sediminibacillus halophilus]